MKVFFLSGIGGDERLFTEIKLPDSFEPVFIPWLPPNPEESLTVYATRLFQPHYSDNDFILIGLSLGGLIAAEIAAVFFPLCVLFISSIPVSSHLPPYYRFAQKMKLHRFLPPIVWKTTSTCKHTLTMRSKKHRQLMRAVIWTGNDRFIRWGIDAVLQWKNTIPPPLLYHIHGSLDDVFPIRYTNPTHIIPRAGHMLVLTHAAQVNAILQEILLPFVPAPALQ